MNLPAYQLAEIVSTLSLPAMAAVVAALSGPDTRDAWAMTGAMLGTVIAVLEARKKDRSLASTVTVVIASAFSGAVAPGLVVANWFPQFAERMTWHLWSASGFAASVVGWAFVIAAMRALITRAPATGEAIADRFAPKNQDDKKL
jgi:predicted membrane protein